MYIAWYGPNTKPEDRKRPDGRKWEAHIGVLLAVEFGNLALLGGIGTDLDLIDPVSTRLAQPNAGQLGYLRLPERTKPRHGLLAQRTGAGPARQLNEWPASS